MGAGRAGVVSGVSFGVYVRYGHRSGYLLGYLGVDHLLELTGSGGGRGGGGFSWRLETMIPLSAPSYGIVPRWHCWALIIHLACSNVARVYLLL